jgi:hypothetical protein
MRRAELLHQLEIDLLQHRIDDERFVACRLART